MNEGATRIFNGIQTLESRLSGYCLAFKPRLNAVNSREDSPTHFPFLSIDVVKYFPLDFLDSFLSIKGE